MPKLTIFRITRPRQIGKIVRDFGDETPDPDFQMKWPTVGVRTMMNYKTGSYKTVSFDTLDDLATLIEGLKPGKEFVTSGVAVDGSRLGKFSGFPSHGRVQKLDTTFPHPRGGGIFVVDVDEVLTPEEVLAQLAEAGIRGVGCVWRPSSGSWLYDARGRQLTGQKGAHFYFRIRDARDIYRAGTVLFKRLWLKGHGWIRVGSAGQALERAIYDRAMRGPSQPCFAAGALCLGGCTQTHREAVIYDGAEVLDSRALLPDLTPAEERTFAELTPRAKDAKADECQAQREAHAIELGRTRLGREPTKREKTEIVKALENLSGDGHRWPVLDLAFVVQFKDGSSATVAEILDDPGRYDGAIVRDPVQPKYLSGKLYTVNYRRAPNLHSMSGVPTTYQLGSFGDRLDQLAQMGLHLLEKDTE